MTDEAAFWLKDVVFRVSGLLKMPSNADIEMHWVDAWNDLYEIVGARRDLPCQLPDWSIVDFEVCKKWLQESVYEGFDVQVKSGWVGHKKGVVVSRSRPEIDANSVITS